MTQKEKAVECLRELDVDAFFIDSFIHDDKVAIFSGFLGFYVSQLPYLEQKIKEVETNLGCLVYAVTHECFSFGECYSFLVISKYEEDWPHSLRGNSSKFMAFSWVWNKTHEDCSEFGYVMLQTGFGGILRIS